MTTTPAGDVRSTRPSPASNADALDREERAGLACIRSALTFFDEWQPIDGVAPTDARTAGVGPSSRRSAPPRSRRYATASSSIRVGGETIDRLTAFARLTVVDDADERRAVFEAMAPTGSRSMATVER